MNKKYHWQSHLLNFVAVILGVYLAFYINERAKQNAERDESMMLMSSLANDLSADIKTYEAYQIPINIKHQERIDNLVKLLQEDDFEGVNRQLSTIFQVENYAPTTSTYSSMQASGKIGLMEDLSLRKRLTDYYENLVIESIKKGEFQVDFFTDELLNWLTNHADLMRMEIVNRGELLVLKNKLMIYGSLIDQKVKSYEMLVEESKALKALLDAQLAVK